MLTRTRIAPVRKPATLNTAAIQRRAPAPQEAQPVDQPDAEEIAEQEATQPQPEENIDTDELITLVAGQLGGLIFGDDAREDIQTGVDALLRILN